MAWRAPTNTASAARARRVGAAQEHSRRVCEVTSLLVATGMSDSHVAPPPRAPGGFVQRGRTLRQSPLPSAAVLPPQDDRYVRVAPAPRPAAGRRKPPPKCTAHSLAGSAAHAAPSREARWSQLEALAAAQPAGGSALLCLPVELLLAVLQWLGAEELARIGGCSKLLLLAAGDGELWVRLWRRRWQLRPPLSMFKPILVYHTPPAAAGPEPARVPLHSATRAQYSAAALCLVGQPLHPPQDGRALDGMASDGPCARAFAASVALRGGLLVHGGWSDQGPDAQELHNGVLSCVHWLRPLHGEGGLGPAPLWQWCAPQVSGSAPRRSHHTATATHGDDVVICGGSDGFHRVPHVHVLDTQVWSWSTARPLGEVPLGLSDHACARRPNGELLLVGKAANPGDVTWTDRWQVKVELVQNRYHAHWTSFTHSGGTLAPRSGHTISLSADESTLLVVGGRSLPMLESVRTGQRTQGAAPPDAADGTSSGDETEEETGAQLWSSMERPLSGVWPPRQARASSPPAQRWDPRVSCLFHHFPCHGVEARPHANDVFYGKLTAESMQAIRPPRLEPAASRRHHVAISVNDDTLMIHGGELYNHTAVSAEVYLLHVATLRWCQPPVFFLDRQPEESMSHGSSAASPEESNSNGSPAASPTKTSLSAPPRLRGHCAQTVDASGARIAIMFGGCDLHGKPCKETWLLEL
ncbi:hypothetical protein AB1Y20_009109 [Prymnesium parvum]|uniref:F-box domain-containing protein n=1 Tax=Prymnesium parvum TaxID=97485 RepID=A0AB34K5Q6_PRYPA